MNQTDYVPLLLDHRKKWKSHEVCIDAYNYWFQVCTPRLQAPGNQELMFCSLLQR